MEEIIIWNVDTQNDFMNENGALSVPEAKKILPNILTIFSKAKEHGIRIMGSADEHTQSSAEFKRNGGIFPDHCIIRTDGQKNIPETILSPEKVGVVHWYENYSDTELKGKFSRQQVILTKDHNDVFTNSHAEALLKTIPKNATICVIGVATEYCVACAVRGLAKYNLQNNMNWKIYVVDDAIKEISQEGKNKFIAEMLFCDYAALTRTNHVINRMENDSVRKEILAGMKRQVHTEKLAH